VICTSITIFRVFGAESKKKRPRYNVGQGRKSELVVV
jgi:hypothetical protein